MPGSSLIASLTEATSRYEANIELARDYLAARGFKQATALSCRLGVVVDPVPGHEGFVGRLAIPYLTRNGVVGMKFRAMDGSEPKYLSAVGAEPHLYHVESFFDDSPFVALTEGELDAAVLTYQVGIPAVGCPGTNTWREHFPRLFAGYDTVFIFADGDKPGLEFAKRVANDLDNARIIPMPDGQDVNETYLNEGPEGLRERCGL